jgi:hypothetical protein
MSLIKLTKDPSVWESFYEYKSGLRCPKAFTAELRRYIDGKEYLPVYEAVAAGKPFPHPSKSVISKLSSSKKRTVYTYPGSENTYLKLLTYLLLRRYDGLFSPSLFSFRPAKSAKDAVRYLLKLRAPAAGYYYKADIHDYFNSIPVEKILPMLRETLADDAPLYAFLSSLLSDPYVCDRGGLISERKGIMAGTPVSAFLANLYLREMDDGITSDGIIYARYSDDIILFAPTEEEAKRQAEKVRETLAGKGLEINPSKESFGRTEDGFSFLGFFIKGKTVDIAPATLQKLKHKMRRKARALVRWKEKNGADGDRAAAAFIRMFNRKLLDTPEDNDLSWSSWFFSVITTTESLKIIDLYAQDCIRFIISGKRNKKRFDTRYSDIKKLGYRNLVHEYYAARDVETDGTPVTASPQ